MSISLGEHKLRVYEHAHKNNHLPHAVSQSLTALWAESLLLGLTIRPDGESGQNNDVKKPA
jgi:hypothetical protein